MNICLVILSPGQGGGAENVVYELARHLRDRGHNISIILNDEIYSYYAELKNIRLLNVGPLFSPRSMARSLLFSKKHSGDKYEYPHNRIGIFLHSYLTDILAYFSTKRIEKEVMQFLRDGKIQVIHSHLTDAALLISGIKHLKIPFIITTHGEHYLRGIPPTHLLIKPLVNWKANRFRKALAKADKIADVSAFMIRSWQKWAPGLENKCIVIHNGINLENIQATKKSDVQLQGRFNLLFPGGAKFIKGGDLLLKSLPAVKKEIEGIHVYIAWHVPQNNITRKLVQDLGLESNVTFVGFLQSTEYLELLKSVDILVLPSRLEAFSVVYIEAMALGKPIIATNTGGTPEAIKDGRNGFLVEPESDQITKAIITLCKNSELRQQISQNNLKDVTQYDWNQVVEQYIETYKSVLLK